MIKKLFLLIFFIFFISTTFSERLYTWGKAENISLDIPNKTLHSYDHFDYVYNVAGYFDVYKEGLHQGRMSFGVFGLINSNSQKKIMSDYAWTWQVIENSKDKICVRAYNNSEIFPWYMDLNVSRYEPLKITHRITNSVGYDITNAQLFYFIDVNQQTNPYINYTKIDGTVYEYDYSTNQQFTSADTNFEQFYSKVELGNFQFLFDDLIDDGFFITRAYFGNLSQLDSKLPDANGFAVGVSKGNQTIRNGVTVISDPTISPQSDAYDGYVEVYNKGNGGASSASIEVGHDSGVGGDRYWNRGIIQFDISSLPQVASAKLYCYIGTVAFTGGKTGNFDLNSIIDVDTGVAGIDWNSEGGDWNSFSYEQVKDNWFDQTVSVGWINTDIKTALNNSISASRNTITFRIAKDTDETYTTDDAMVVIRDTGLPNSSYIEYSTIDANIWKVDDYDFNSTLPMFSYKKDGNLTVTWWTRDTTQKDLNSTGWIGTTSGAKTTRIFGDLNLSLNNGLCDTNNSANGMVCLYDFNISILAIPTIADGNYFLTLDTNNGTDVNTAVSSKSFMVDNTVPSTAWDGNHNIWQSTDANIHLTCNIGTGSGCSSTKYRLDTNSATGITFGAWAAFDTNVLVFQDGNWAIDFNSTDVAGNVGDTNTFYVLIDKTAPTSNSVSVTSFSGTGKYTFANPPPLTTSSSDSGSGVSQMKFSCNNSTYSSYEAYATSKNNFNVRTGSGCIDADGNKTVYVIFKDNVGNESTAVNTGSFYLDTINPTFSSIVVSSFSGLAGYTNQEKPPLSLTASDSGAELYDINFSCNNTTFSSPISFVATYSDFNVAIGAGCSNVDGNKTIYSRIRDRAYNVGTANTASFVLDRIVPILSNALPSSNAIVANPVPDFNADYSETNFYYCRTRPFKNIIAQADVNATISGGKCLYSAFPPLASGNTMLAQFSVFDLANNSMDLNTATYTYASLDFNVWQVENRDLNVTGDFYFSYSRDKNLSIRFWANDIGQRDKNANLWYSKIKYQKEFVVFRDLNLSSNNGLCDGNGMQQLCSKDWNIFGVGDGNYWLTLEIRVGSDVNFVSSPRNVFVDNNAPIVLWDGNSVGWQTIDQNIHLTCSDGIGSACVEIYFRRDQDATNDLNFSDWNTFDQNVLFNQDGNWAIDFNAIDRAGNYSDLNSQSFLIDENTPVLDNNYLSVGQGTSIQPSVTVIIYADVNDALSGFTGLPSFNIQKPDGTDYNWTMSLIDSNHYKYEYSSTTIAGTYRVKTFYATDIAGNTLIFSTNMYFVVSGGDGGGDGGGGGGGGGPPMIIEKTALDLNFVGTNCGTNCLDNYFLYFPFDKLEKTHDLNLLSSIPIKSCEVGRLKQNFSCILDSNKIVTVRFSFSDDNVFMQTLKTEFAIESFEEKTSFVSVSRTIINFGVYIKFPFKVDISEEPIVENPYVFKIEDHNIIGVRLWWIISVIVIFIGLAAYHYVKKNKKG